VLTHCVEPIDAELSKKLAEELKLESGMDGGIEIPSTVTDYLENGPFKVLSPLASGGMGELTCRSLTTLETAKSQ
jgi:hypothetical protein